MQNRENILAEVANWLDDINYLEELLDDQVEYQLQNIRSSRTPEGIVRVARRCREALGLDDEEPIHDICGLLESGGIKVYRIDTSSDGFFGLSVSRHDGGPAVVVNAWERIPIERQIFSAAHELGHLVLHKDAFDVEIVEEDQDQEQQADLFAGHFIMPDEGFVKEWNEAAGLHVVDRVFKVKGIFHVSYKTVLHRLIEHEVVDNSVWKNFNLAYQRRFNKKLSFKEEPAGTEHAEPFGLDEFDFYEDRFRRLVRQAVEEDKISMSRGAEMLRISIEEMRELTRSWEPVL